MKNYAYNYIKLFILMYNKFKNAAFLLFKISFRKNKGNLAFCYITIQH